MFADPQSVTINSVAKSLPRITTGDMQAVYENNDQTFKLEISHQETKQGRVRSNVKLTQRKVVTDPLTSASDYDNLVISLVFDRPGYGFTETELDQLRAGLFSWLDSTATAKLFGRES